MSVRARAARCPLCVILLFWLTLYTLRAPLTFVCMPIQGERGKSRSDVQQKPCEAFSRWLAGIELCFECKRDGAFAIGIVTRIDIVQRRWKHTQPRLCAGGRRLGPE